jgi:hypothetical protein
VVTEHWNPTVHSLAEGVLKHYADRDPDAYAKCISDMTKAKDARAEATARRKAQWDALIRSAGGV